MCIIVICWLARILVLKAFDKKGKMNVKQFFSVFCKLQTLARNNNYSEQLRPGV